MSRMRFVPVVAIPPACIKMYEHRTRKSELTVGVTDLFSQERHRESLIQKTQFSRLRLHVIRISKDAAVQECTMNISHHGADVSSAIGRLLLVFRELD